MHYAIASTHCELSGLDNFRLAIFLASAAAGPSTLPHYWRLQMPGRSQPNLLQKVRQGAIWDLVRDSTPTLTITKRS